VQPRIIAAVDLGSNSFHMVIARVAGMEPRVIDRLRVPVRLAAGMDGNGTVAPDAVERARACLLRFSERLRAHPGILVRAVGTNTFRRARSPRRFLALCEQALGFPIEVVPGREEGRLIHLGVVQSAPALEGRHLVLDIGGGSTECILGEGTTPLRVESLEMGSVVFTERFFPEGAITAEAFRAAELAAGREVQTIARPFRTLGFETCLGSSGTILAVAHILSTRAGSQGGITRHGLRDLARELIDQGHVERLELPGLRPDRTLVLPGGLAILRAVFRGLRLRRLEAVDGALREGVLHDLIGRIRHKDSRDDTVRSFAQRHHVDAEQAARVGRTALRLFRRVAREWELDEVEDRHLLSWAAAVHEAGMVVSYSGYQKHGAYLIENSDLPGFSREERSLLAAVVRAHRRRLAPEIFAGAPEARRERAVRLALILRLSVVLNRARSPRPLPPFQAEAGPDRRLLLRFPRKWLQDHPLVQADLEEERGLLREFGARLSIEQGRA
jgi:exopolyphosphatase/guanosine-5'-triphosphate,3'-diphosphate pyrophosphatase